MGLEPTTFCMASGSWVRALCGLLPKRFHCVIRWIAGTAARTASSQIRGKPGTTVQLTVVSPSHKSRTLTVKRAKLRAPLTEGRLVKRRGVKLGVTELSSFGEGAHGKVRQQVDKLLGEGAKGIVLDLRGNGGGLLQEGRLVASIFVEKGLIVSTNGRASPEQKQRLSELFKRRQELAQKSQPPKPKPKPLPNLTGRENCWSWIIARSIHPSPTPTWRWS